MKKPRSKYLLYLAGLLGLCLLLTFYSSSKYEFLKSPIHSIEIKFNQEVSKEQFPIAFVSKNSDSKFDLKKPVKHKVFKDSLMRFEFDPQDKIRKVRVYFVKPNDTLLFSSIGIITGNKKEILSLKKIGQRGVKLKRDSKVNEVFVFDKYGFIEFPYTFLYPTDFTSSYILVAVFILLYGLVFVIFRLLQPTFKELNSLSDIIIAVFLFSIFLPHPIFNITLILLIGFHVRKISWKQIGSNKINLLFLGFFLLYTLNNLFISPDGFEEMSTVERILPMLILGLVIPSIAKRKHLYVFVYSTFAIGIWFLFTSAFDVYIHSNFEFLSFNLFTKYLHPIYFSYLVFFSILFVEINMESTKKYIIQVLLLAFLVFSGSKLVLIVSLLVMGIKVLNSRKRILFLIPAILILLLFFPLKDRFKEILNTQDLTVLTEQKIEEPNDSRINGLTLRLILWREALSTMSIQDVFLGKGVTKETDHILRDRLITLGLKNHQNYNVHNQFVDTFWRTGVLGFLILIFIVFLGVSQGIKAQDNLVVLFSIFLFFAMLSECVFERVNGIYFFTAVFLFMVNSFTQKKELP